MNQLLCFRALGFYILSSSVIFAAASATALGRRWTNGDSATGTTDPNVSSGCDDWANSITASDTCAALESYFGITAAQLVLWRLLHSRQPTTKTRTTTPRTTTSSSTAGVPSPTQSGLASNCDAFYLVKAGDYCYKIVTSYGNFTLDQFYDCNPAVKRDCSGLQAGYYVCIGVAGSTTTSAPSTTSTSSTTTTTTTAPGPSPTQSGITTDCVTFYQAVPGDSCWSIVNEKYTYLTSDEFYAWNPAVGSTCANLRAGYYYCLATKSVPPMSNTIST